MSKDQQQPASAGDATATEGFGTKSLTIQNSPAQAALVARAQAEVQARYIVAMQRPRDWGDVRVRILNECKRPGFAATARYRKPIGRGVEGPSIRFAETCVRYAGNMDVQTATIYDDRTKRILRVSVVDLETNASFGADVAIDKTVERRDSKDRVVIATRTNTAGQTVYIVEATEDELLNKQNAMISKTIRTQGLRLIPGDIIEEGQAQCIATTQGEHKNDPAAARKKVADGFAKFGVMPSHLAEYLGHPLDQMSPAEYQELRDVFQTIADGETTWAAVVEAKLGPRKDGEPPTGPSQAGGIAERIKTRSAATEAPPPEKKKGEREPGEEG